MNLSPALLALVSLVAGNWADQYGSCNFQHKMDPNTPYYLYNPGYNNFYRPGSSCRWDVSSRHPINLTCDIFNIPTSYGCQLDALILSEFNGQTWQSLPRQCGNQPITYTTRTNRLVIDFVSGPLSPGGRFRCTYTSTVPGYCKCGKKNPSRIVGGRNARVNEFPMMASLVHRVSQMITCGATIINPQQLLTAAHCVMGEPKEKFYAVVGDHDQFRKDETAASQSFALQKVEYLLEDNNFRSRDLAVVTIRGRIPFNQQVGAVCLPFKNRDARFFNANVSILGWGAPEYASNPSAILKTADVKVIPNDKCQYVFPYQTNRNMCSQSNVSDFCQWDSGGPMIWENPTTERLVQIGIMSDGAACGDGVPGLHTRVGAFLDWIEAVKPRGYEYCKLE